MKKLLTCVLVAVFAFSMGCNEPKKDQQKNAPAPSGENKEPDKK